MAPTGPPGPSFACRIRSVTVVAVLAASPAGGAARAESLLSWDLRLGGSRCNVGGALADSLNGVGFGFDAGHVDAGLILGLGSEVVTAKGRVAFEIRFGLGLPDVLEDRAAIEGKHRDWTFLVAASP